MNWFSHCRTIDEVKAEYRRLCFIHHPDHGGDGTVMQSINVAYRMLVRDGLPGPNAPSTPPGGTFKRPRRSGPYPRQDSESHPEYSREYLRRIWDSTPWQTSGNGYLQRAVGGFIVTLLPFAAGRRSQWAVQVGNIFSMFAFETQAEAEKEAFNLLCEQLQGGTPAR